LDFCLIAAGWLNSSTWIGILEVAVGLGLVIFVHEFGHFAVAKMCGVKCEKFYLGFDIGGLKLCKFTVGETEYGIGVLPLGGYVKMLGQVDNPAQLREEIERAKQKAEKTESPATSEEKTPDIDRADPPDGGEQPETPESPEDEEIDLAAAEAALYDPRSYLAKSVPKRMAIISAGVIMNLIFAFIMAAIAYKLGVKQVVCEIGQLVPGKTAWQLDLKVGDRITDIDGRKMRHFRDLKANVSLGNIEDGLPIEVKRPGVKEPIRVVTWPDSSGRMPVIGVAPPRDTTLVLKMPGSAATKAEPPLEEGDEIVKIDGTPVGNYPELRAYLALHPQQTLKVTVERPAKTEGKVKTDDPPTEHTVEVPPNPMRRLGLVMEMGKITAVQSFPPGDPRDPEDNSPAAKAGIKPGDIILEIDGQPPGDPMTLPARLQQRAGETITLTIKPGIEETGAKSEARSPAELFVEAGDVGCGTGGAARRRVPVTLREADWYETPLSPNTPMSIPALGIAYEVLDRVDSVIESTPAAEAGLRPGDRIVEAIVIPPDKKDIPEDFPRLRKRKIPFSQDEYNWPYLIHELQRALPGSEIELTWDRAGEKKTRMLTWYEAGDWFNPDRGFRTGLLLFPQKGETWGEAIQFGAEETLDSTLLVFRVLSKLGGQFSATNLGGPIMIFAMAKGAADEGISELLLFLTIISANLAVLNFLPIPVLDGGHMVLLTYEGIRRKPPDERIVAALTWLGLLFILTLMFWVIGMDIHRLFTGFY